MRQKTETWAMVSAWMPSSASAGAVPQTQSAQT
jgi:hypothetical protein